VTAEDSQERFLEHRLLVRYEDGVCVCVRERLCTCDYLFIYLFIYICVCIYLFIYLFIYMCVYLFIYLFIYLCVCVCVCVCVSGCVCERGRPVPSTPTVIGVVM
jgi:hypothetical protein